MEVISAFVWREGVEERSDAVPQGINGALGGFSEKGFELCEELLDWIEVRRIGRQVQQGRSFSFDRLAYSRDLVGT